MANSTMIYNSNITTTEPPVNVTSLFGWVELCKVILSILGVVGNLLVIAVFTSVKRLRTTTNYFIISLACADFISSLTILPLPIPSYIPSNLAGELYCRVIYSTAFLWISFKASVFNLVAVTIERYFAIVMSTKHKKIFTKRNCHIFILIVWLCAATVESLAFYIFPYDYTLRSCIIWWPNENYRLAVGVLLYLASFLIPVIILLIVYTRILVFLKQHAKAMLSRNENNSPAYSLLKAREKVVKMLFIVVITFTVCWAPNQTLFLAFNYGAPLDHYATYYQFFIILAFCNSCLNPMIYSFKNKQFRDGLQIVFCKKTTKILPGSSEQTQAQTVHTVDHSV
ncbi:galanin receptor type 1-like [Saccoglossus kowalevskii]|uniref:Neuropeptide FF receptor 2-like n=1 Tax=Saccoglossus kowalevskii TaxID=10224 RepID=A0ABM0MJA5_SACKO|nr:PREDICTED: neuropeptide FF receptor 2-like [Saccoglossus kowalevskii]